MNKEYMLIVTLNEHTCDTFAELMSKVGYVDNSDDLILEHLKQWDHGDGSECYTYDQFCKRDQDTIDYQYPDIGDYVIFIDHDLCSASLYIVVDAD